MKIKMKKAGFYLVLAFAINLIGNLLWFLTFIFDEPLFGYEYLENLVMILIYTLSGVFGLIAGFILFKSGSSSR